MTKYDYLVVGAGATGLCFIDVMLRYTKKTIILVDKNNEPGGHWSNYYPYVKLHQNPSTYGVESIPLKDDSGKSIKEHFKKALETFTKYPNFTYLFNTEIDLSNIKIPHTILVDARYLEVKKLKNKWNISTPWNLKLINKPHIVIGGGKTGMDTCIWLIKHKIKVKWIVSHHAYWLIKEKIKNLGNIPNSIFLLKIKKFIINKLNPTFSLSLDNRFYSSSNKPTRYKCAIVNKEEYNIIKNIEIINNGYVTKKINNTLYFENNESIDFGDVIFVNCIQNGCPIKNTVPIFQKNKIILQPIILCQSCFSATCIAKMEALNSKLDIIPIKYPKTPKDGIYGYSESEINLAKLYNSNIKNEIFNSRLNQYIIS